MTTPFPQKPLHEMTEVELRAELADSRCYLGRVGATYEWYSQEVRRLKHQIDESEENIMNTIEINNLTEDNKKLKKKMLWYKDIYGTLVSLRSVV